MPSARHHLFIHSNDSVFLFTKPFTLSFYPPDGGKKEKKKKNSTIM